MMGENFAVLAGSAGVIGFLAWFFFGPKKSRQAVLSGAGIANTAPELQTAERCDLSVKGMHCASCVGRVENALKKVPGVQDATVNLLAERAAVRFDSKQTKPEDLIAALGIAGYDAQVKDFDRFSAKSEREQTARQGEKQTETRELLRRFWFQQRCPFRFLSWAWGRILGCFRWNGQCAAGGTLFSSF